MIRCRRTYGRGNRGVSRCVTKRGGVNTWKYVRIIASHLSELALKYQPNKHQRLLAGFLFRTLINAILRPDTFDIVEKPYIPFPKLKENLFLITRVLENLISGVVFTKQYSVLSFTNAFIQGPIYVKKKRKYKRRNSRICLRNQFSDLWFFFLKIFHFSTEKLPLLEGVLKTFATIPPMAPNAKTAIETTLTSYFADNAFVIQRFYQNKGL